MFSSLQKQLATLFLITSMLLIYSNVNAQVTVGSAIPPNDGALLDLKQYKSKTSGENSNMGLMLPRVDLDRRNSLKPSVSNHNPGDLNFTHEGLLVFNTTTNSELCPGLYVWNSVLWDRLYGSCQSMSAIVNNPYVLDGSDEYFTFISETDWTATVKDDDNILDLSKMQLSGTASSTHQFKLQFNVIPEPNTNPNIAVITFTDSKGNTLDVVIEGEPVYLHIDPSNWNPEVDADQLALIPTISTNSKKAIKLDIPTAATWLTSSTTHFEVTANVSEVQRMAQAKIYLDGLEAQSMLNKTLDVTQDNMTLDISVGWILRLTIEGTDIPEAEQKEVIVPLENWVWGDRDVLDDEYGYQPLLWVGESTPNFYLKTNSKKPISFEVGESLDPVQPVADWISLREAPIAIAGQEGDYKMQVHVDVNSRGEHNPKRKGFGKVKVKGGLEKDLTIVQDSLWSRWLFSYEVMIDANHDGEFTVNISDLDDEAAKQIKEEPLFVVPQMEFVYSKPGWITIDSYDETTTDFKFTVSPNTNSERDIRGAIADIYTGTKGVRVQLIQPKTTYNIPKTFEMLASEASDLVLDDTYVGNIEVNVPQQDKEWLDVTIDETNNTIEFNPISLNISDKDRETEVEIQLDNLTKKVKISQPFVTLYIAPFWTSPVDANNTKLDIATNVVSELINVAYDQTDGWWIDAKIHTSLLGKQTLETTVKPNLTGVERQIEITIFIEDKVTGAKEERIILISQPPMTFDLAIEGHKTWEPNHDGDTRSSIITTNSKHDITATSSESWVAAEVTKNSNGNFTVKLDAQPNITEAIRTANIVLQIGTSATEGLTKTIEVTQNPITLSFDPASWNVEPIGGSLDVTIHTNSTKTPIPSSNQTWLIATIGGNGKLKLTASANAETVPRTAIVIVNVNGLIKEFHVSQKVKTTLEIDPETWPAPIDGGTKLITVTTNSTQAPTANSNETWVTTNVEANKNVTLTASQNLTAASRTAIVTITVDGLSKKVTVTQDKATLIVQPETWIASINGDRKIVEATSTSTLPITMTSDASWLTIDTGTKEMIAEANPTAIAREATVTVKQGVLSKKIKVTQIALELIVPADWAPSVDGLEQANIVSSNSSLPITMTSDATIWLTVPVLKNVKAEANPTEAIRTGIITVKQGNLTKVIKVTQDKLTLTVSPDAWDAPINGGNKSLVVNTNSTQALTITSTLPWVTTDAVTKVISTTANTTASNRTATVNVKQGNITRTVNVKQAVATLNVAASLWAAPVNGGRMAIGATSNSNTPIITTSNQPWVTIDATTKEMVAAPNPNSAVREAQVTVKQGELYKTIKVTQIPLALTVTPTWAASINGAEKADLVSSNSTLPITMTSNATTWLTVPSVKNVKATPNPTELTRTGTITVKQGNLTKEIKVSQIPLALTVDPTWTPGVNGAEKANVLSSNSTLPITMTSNATSWLTVPVLKNIKASANPNESERTGTITIKQGSVTKGIKVTQEKVTLTVAPASWSPSVDKVSQAITITTNSTLVPTMTSNATTWLTANAGAKTMTAGDTNLGTQRTGIVTVKVGNTTRAINVSQQALTIKWATAADGANLTSSVVGGTSIQRKFVTNTKREIVETVVVNNANSKVNGTFYPPLKVLGTELSQSLIYLNRSNIAVHSNEKGNRSSTVRVRIKDTNIQTPTFTITQPKIWMYGVVEGTSLANNKLYFLPTTTNMDIPKMVENPTKQTSVFIDLNYGMSVTLVWYYSTKDKKYVAKITKPVIPSNMASANFRFQVVLGRKGYDVWEGLKSPLITELQLFWKKGNKSAFDDEGITYIDPIPGAPTHVDAGTIRVEVEMKEEE